MSDNTTANVGTGGDVFATKDIGGIKYPRNILTTPSGTDITPLSEGGTVVTTPPANASTNIAQIAGTVADVNSGLKSAGTIRVVIATDQPALTNAQPVAQSGTWNIGTITTLPALVAGSALIGKVGIDQTTPGTTNAVQANAGTNLNTSALALDASVTGLQVAQGSTTSGQKGELAQAAVTTSPPSYTNAQTSPLTMDTSGNLRIAGNVGITSGGVTVSQGTAANLQSQVQGVTAAGAAAGGNPVQVGAVFNTTQPTWAAGQAVSLQGTARGAQIVATGVDTFSINTAQLNGTTTDTNSGNKSAGTLRVVLATDQPALTNKLLVTPDSVALPANQSVNVAQVNGSTTVASVTGVQDVMPRKRTGSTGLAPNYSASHITTKTTTTPTAATCYVSAIAICVTGAGTSQTLTIVNKEGTPKTLYTAGAAIAVGNTYIQFPEPILMTSGIDIITGGTTAGTQDVFITYWQ